MAVVTWFLTSLTPDKNDDSKSDADSDKNDDSESEFSDVYAGVEPDEVDDFSRLDIWREINKTCRNKTGKEKSKIVLKTISNLMLLTRVLRHDDVFAAIMQNVEALQINYSMGFDEALEHAVFMRRIFICNKLTLSGKETKMDDASSKFSNSDDENDYAIKDTEDDYDVWENITDKLDDENVSGLAKTNRALELVLCAMKCGFVWHHESLCKEIMVKARKAWNQ